MKLRMIRVVLDGEEAPHYTVTKAFEQQFEVVETIWWQKYPDKKQLNQVLEAAVMTLKPDVVFMQVQQAGVIFPETVRKISRDTLVINWTGDVRTDISWYIELGKAGALTLFTNNTDVDKMRKLNLKADYLQIGYDHMYYYPQPEIEKLHNIVFCGNYYPDHNFPLTRQRVQAVHALKTHFADGFNLYGGHNWKNIQLHPECPASNEEEAKIYNSCSIAISISHFDYKRYYSDRLLRELACGAFVLSHRFQDCEMEFQDGVHLVYFDTKEEMIEKCKYYYNKPELRAEIGANAAAHVKKHCTWEVRVKELEELIYKYTLNEVPFETKPSVMNEFIDKLQEKGVKITFGLQPNHIKRIEQEIARWNDIRNSEDTLPDGWVKYTEHFWDKLGKEFSWHPLTLALYYFQHLEDSKPIAAHHN
jgi:hypothetical protein